jgi:hypothetical protein
MISRSNPTHLAAQTLDLDREACLRLDPATGRRRSRNDASPAKGSCFERDVPPGAPKRTSAMGRGRFARPKRLKSDKPYACAAPGWTFRALHRVKSWADIGQSWAWHVEIRTDERACTPFTLAEHRITRFSECRQSTRLASITVYTTLFIKAKAAGAIDAPCNCFDQALGEVSAWVAVRRHAVRRPRLRGHASGPAGRRFESRPDSA